MMDPSSLTLFEGTSANLPQCLRLLLAQFGEHSIALDEATVERGLQQLLLEPSLGRVVLARDGQEVIGLAVLAFTWTLEHGGRTAWLDELFVLPERRGQGVGRQLLQEALRVAEEAGCIAVELEVESSHSRAANLYAREGFERRPRTRWVRRLAGRTQGKTP